MIRIAEDCSKQLYRSSYLHFVTRIERPIMEMFANALIATNSVSQITKIYDEYLDTICLEPTLFTLNMKDSFRAFNDPSSSEIQIRAFMNHVAMGILSMIRIMGVIPIIRAPTGGAAEMLARDVCAIVRENISPRGAAYSLLSGCLVSDKSRPLLLIFDRNSDLATPVIHTSTYQSLIDDLLDHKLNRVNIELAKGPTDKKKPYDLNTQTDAFFSRYAGTTMTMTTMTCTQYYLRCDIH
jgi:hypothetical protein